MARNPERRAALLDAGLRVLAAHGARGLTHRAVDREAGVPIGTTSNYARSRAMLLAGLCERVFERLAPDADSLATIADVEEPRARAVDYLRHILQRMTREPALTLALLELRLEAARSAEVEALIGSMLRDGFTADVAFHEAEGLPGGRLDVALERFAMDGLLLDLVTTRCAPDVDPAEVVDALAARLLP